MAQYGTWIPYTGSDSLILAVGRRRQMHPCKHDVWRHEVWDVRDR